MQKEASVRADASCC